MARARTISPDFWTSESVIDCAPMTRLLFIGLWNFADDLGVQPLRPRTIRLQVFPGDGLDDQRMRAMIEELAARGLVRIYTVEGQDYLEIVDWHHMQRVGKRAKRRYPTDHHAEERPPADGSPVEEPAGEVAVRGEKEEEWRAAIEARLHSRWPQAKPLEADSGRSITAWIEAGCALETDVLTALDALRAPPAALNVIATQVIDNRNRRVPARA